MKEALIQYIHTSQLIPHPQNPRRNLGDLTELADSIRERGVLQNLTVVRVEGPDADPLYTSDVSGQGYMIVIGHRRHAAAMMAELAFLPCIVTEMTPTEQLETMLLENVQRSDLTVAEEAQGFHQLRFDMGVSVEEISRKTGYSESKIRQRLKIAELPTEQVQQRIECGATLQDVIAVAEFEDEKQREKLLELAGTRNFSWEMQQARDALQADEQRERLIDQLKTLEAEEIKLPKGKQMWMSEYRKYHQTQYIYLPKKEDLDITAGLPDGYAGKLFYRKQDKNTYATYYLDPNAEEIDAAAAKTKADEEAEKQRQDGLKALQKKFQAKRMLFIQEQKCDKMNEGKMTALLQEAAMAENSANADLLYDLLDFDDDEDEAVRTLEQINELREAVGQPKITRPKLSLYLWYCMTDTRTGVAYRRSWDYDYKKMPDAEELYETLINRLGYEMTEEEAAWRDGSHKLHAKPESEGADGG